MKNRIAGFLLVLVAGGIMLSCNKVIDKNPTHTIDGEDYFKSVDDYELALIGSYQRLKQNSLYAGVNGGSGFLCCVDIAADNFYGGPDNLGNLNTVNRWNYAANSGVVGGIWLAAYNVIQQCNLTTRGIDRFRTASPATVNRIEGQARALRAFMHFELLRWWCNDYDRNSTAPGIPYVDVFNVEQMPARGTVKETYDKMEADFRTAKSMMSSMDRSIQSVSSVTAGNRAYIDTLVVDAMMARMFLYANQLDSAIKYSTIVINRRGLASAADFPFIWEDATTAEVIWAVKFEAGDEALAREIYQPSQELISWEVMPSALTQYTGGDIRGNIYFGNVSGSTVLTKYLAKSASAANPDGNTDFKIFRTGEMYLIRAEARARKALDASALTDLNTLRSARGASTGAETGAGLLTAIQNERRKELIVEGHRFFDLKRTTRAVARASNCGNFCTLAPTSRAWNFPIPQTEMLANPNMQQNPGY